MMQKNIVVSMALLAMLASSLVLPFAVYAVQPDDVKAEKFIDIAEKAYDQAVQLRDQAESDGFDVTVANELIADGEVLLDAAKTSFAAANYADAFEDAKAAQLKFRDTIASLDLSTVEDEVEKGEGLLVAIDRSRARIQRLTEVVDSITPTDDNQDYIDWVNANLTAAELKLSDAESALQSDPVDMSLAASLHEEANKYIEDAFKALKLIGDWTVNWRAESFLNGIKNQVDKAEDQIDQAEADGVDVTAFRAQLSEINQLIADAKTKLLDGDKKGALGDVKDARDSLKDLMKDLMQSTKPHGNQNKNKL